MHPVWMRSAHPAVRLNWSGSYHHNMGCIRKLMILIAKTGQRVDTHFRGRSHDPDKCNRLVYNIDLFATIIESANGVPSTALPSRSLGTELEGKRASMPPTKFTLRKRKPEWVHLIDDPKNQDVQGALNFRIYAFFWTTYKAASWYVARSKTHSKLNLKAVLAKYLRQRMGANLLLLK